jgi:hypothetical protein
MTDEEKIAFVDKALDFAEEKSRVRIDADISAAVTFSAAMSGVGLIAAVVSQNEAEHTLSERDFCDICEGAAVALLELAVLLSFWKIDLWSTVGTFLNTVLEDEAAEMDEVERPAPTLHLVRKEDS